MMTIINHDHRCVQSLWHHQVQFIYVCLEEQFSSLIRTYKIYRECIQTPDGGLIALDWWVDSLSLDTDGDDEKEEEMAHFGDVYESKTYLQFAEDTYGRYRFPNGDQTPILFIFSTVRSLSFSVCLEYIPALMFPV